MTSSEDVFLAISYIPRRRADLGTTLEANARFGTVMAEVTDCDANDRAGDGDRWRGAARRRLAVTRLDVA
jgi:hypothetical protein